MPRSAHRSRMHGEGWLIVIAQAVWLLLGAQVMGAEVAPAPNWPQQSLVQPSIDSAISPVDVLPAAFPSIDEVAAQQSRPSDSFLGAPPPANQSASPSVHASMAAFVRPAQDPLPAPAVSILPPPESPSIEVEGANGPLGTAAQSTLMGNRSEGLQPSIDSSGELGFDSLSNTRVRLAPSKGWLRNWLGPRHGSDLGLGFERVMLAPMATETACGAPSVGIKVRYNRGASNPDRLEYLWSRPGKGPAAERELELLDTILHTELGSSRAVVISQMSMRSVNPETNGNTTGFGDMVVGGKAVIYEGSCARVSSIFLTYLNTGPADRGLGSGHVSLEPGVLGMFQWSDRTFLHTAVQYRLPIAGSPGLAGDVLTSSCAVSSIWQETDDFAWMPLLEFQTHSFLFGSQTEPSGSVTRVNGTTAFEILPGSRLAFGKSPFGALELGISSGLRVSDSDWFDSRLMFDVRWLR